ncbi:MAG TPA: HEAT repeat domain-containing protein, partial [Gemmatimonadales bacterium]
MPSTRFLLLSSLLASTAAAQTPAPPAPPARTRPATPPVPPAPTRMPALGIPLRSLDFDWQAPVAAELDRAAVEGQFTYRYQLDNLPGLDTPMALLPGVGFGTLLDEAPAGAIARLRPEQGAPEDSLYRAAREALNRGEYARASTLFRSLEQKYPRSRVAPAALYYRAFALYRSGATEELRSALEALKAQQDRYPEAASDPDASALRTRLYAALAARGDAEAASALRAASAGGASCDKEDVEVRAEALNALTQIDASEARPTLKKVLARRDECSVRLRRSAVYILGRSGTEEAAADLLEVARNDPDPSVRSDAIVLLGRSSGAATVRTLETIFNEATDDRARQAALSALRNKGGPEAARVLKAIIERNDVPERMRAEAISQLAGGALSWSETVRTVGGQLRVAGAAQRRTVAEDNEDAAWLRGLYARTTSPVLKSAIIGAVARMGGTANDQFVLGIVKNRDEEVRMRREALSRLRVSTLSVDELGKLFDALSERDLRSAVVNQLASREEPA